ncbi:MAG: oligosaccharide flippase family protein [Elusimicrobia bacterium]|nr:oligosaccharide flippase family protein [Elusimicrobiota bacterium]
MTENGTNVTNSLYRRLAGERLEQGARDFIRNLSWIGLCFALAKIISALVSIAAGRLLGPAEFGKINVLVSAGAALSPFIIAGLNGAVIRYGVDPADRDRVFTAAGALVLALALATTAFVLLFRTALSAFFGISPAMLGLALCYALATAAFLLASGLLQAAGNFSKRGLSEIGFSVLLAAVFFFAVYHFGRTYEAMAYAYIAAFGGIGFFWLTKIGCATELSFPEKEKFRALAQYSAYSFGSGLGYFLMMNVQGLIINAFLAPKEVGIYAAYNTATIGIAAYLGYAIGTVLFPKASASTNRKRLWEIAVRSWVRLAPAAIVCFIGVEAAVLALMGRHQYGMQSWLMLLFAVAGAITLAHSSLAQIVFSEGVKASRLSLFMSWGGGLVNFAACLLFIPVFKVGGAALALILTYVFLLAWLWKVKDSYL